jgi:hypothetical protein
VSNNNTVKEIVIEAKSNVFNYKTLKQKNQKITDKWISPSFNPGAIKRLKSKNNLNVGKKYTVQKELYYEESGKKSWLNIGDVIQFVKEH